MARFAMDRHKGLDDLGKSTLVASSSSVPGIKYLETAQHRLDASFPGYLKLSSFTLPGEKEFERLIKKSVLHSRQADQYAAAVSFVTKSRSSPLALLGKAEIEAIKSRPVRQSSFRTLHSSLLFTETKPAFGMSKGKESLRMVSQAILKGDISHPHVTEETNRLLAQATDLTAISTLPSSHFERVWIDFSSFCTRHGLDPWLAS